MRFYRNADIESRAEQRLSQLESILKRPLTAPVPIDLIVEKVFRLSILWETIDEDPTETIFGAIIPKDRLIIMNESRKDLFQQKPGLERFTLGHELGHWDLFVDEATLDHPLLFALDQVGPFRLRSSGVGDVIVLKRFIDCPEMIELLAKMEARADIPDEERSVNRYAAGLLMPRALLENEVFGIDRTQWRNLYRLAEKLGVTISALGVRLKQLGLLYIDETGTLYESADLKFGQQKMF